MSNIAKLKLSEDITILKFEKEGGFTNDLVVISSEGVKNMANQLGGANGKNDINLNFSSFTFYLSEKTLTIDGESVNNSASGGQALQCLNESVRKAKTNFYDSAFGKSIFSAASLGNSIAYIEDESGNKQPPLYFDNQPAGNDLQFDSNREVKIFGFDNEQAVRVLSV